jgi:hypothetical protein
MNEQEPGIFVKKGKATGTTTIRTVLPDYKEALYDLSIFVDGSRKADVSISYPEPDECGEVTLTLTKSIAEQLGWELLKAAR